MMENFTYIIQFMTSIIGDTTTVAASAPPIVETIVSSRSGPYMHYVSMVVLVFLDT